MLAIIDSIYSRSSIRTSSKQIPDCVHLKRHHLPQVVYRSWYSSVHCGTHIVSTQPPSRQSSAPFHPYWTLPVWQRMKINISFTWFPQWGRWLIITQKLWGLIRERALNQSIHAKHKEKNVAVMCIECTGKKQKNKHIQVYIVINTAVLFSANAGGWDWCFEGGSDRRQPAGRVKSKRKASEGEQIWKFTSLTGSQYQNVHLDYGRTSKARRLLLWLWSKSVDAWNQTD